MPRSQAHTHMDEKQSAESRDVGRCFNLTASILRAIYLAATIAPFSPSGSGCWVSFGRLPQGTPSAEFSPDWWHGSRGGSRLAGPVPAVRYPAKSGEIGPWRT